MRKSVRIMIRPVAAMTAGAAALVLFTGCETTGGGSQMENTVFSIHRKVSNLEGDLGESVERLNDTSAELTMRVQESEAQTRRLGGMIEENQRKLTMVEQKLDQLSKVVYEEFGRTAPSTPAPAAAEDVYVPAPPSVGSDASNGDAANLETAQTMPPPSQPAPPEEPEAMLEEPSTPAGNPTLDYKRAQDAYIDEDYEQALRLYDDFLEKYPANEQAKSALFWKGGSQMKLQRYSEAINTYEQLIQDYSGDTDKVPSAMFNQAVAHINTGNRSRAVEILNTIVERYPDTLAAERARKALGS